jgi:hypothetical protein
MTRPTRIPSDVNRPDRILGPFTARQVAILAATAAALYLAWTALRTQIALPVFLIGATPVAALAFVIAVGQRDGLPLDRLLLAAIRHRTGPRRITNPRPSPAPTGGPVPAWITAHATTTGDAQRLRDRGQGRWRQGRRARFPARAVTSTPATGTEPGGVGVVDLGPDGLVVIAVVSTVNLTLRTPDEQDGLVDGFARYLHSLTGPVQFLVRALPLDLTGHLRQLHVQARELPHPALAAAAAGHRDHLARLAAGRGEDELLTRQVLLILREPARGAGAGADRRLLRRLHDAAALLAPLDVTVTPLNAAQTTALLSGTCNPDHDVPDEQHGEVIQRRARRDHRGGQRTTAGHGHNYDESRDEDALDDDGHEDDGHEDDGHEDDGHEDDGFEDEDEQPAEDLNAPGNGEYEVVNDEYDGQFDRRFNGGELVDDWVDGDPDAEAWEPDPWAEPCQPRAAATRRSTR